MIFLLRETFKRRGMEGYKPFHHYADIGLTATAGAAAALLIGTDTAEARQNFEHAVFFAGAASLVLAFRTATASEPDVKSARVVPYLTKFLGGAALGMVIAAAPLFTLPGVSEMGLKAAILQDNQDYVPLRKRQKAAEKAAAEAARQAAEAEAATQLAAQPADQKADLKNVSHETIPAIAVPQKRGLGL